MLLRQFLRTAQNLSFAVLVCFGLAQIAQAVTPVPATGIAAGYDLYRVNDLLPGPVGDLILPAQPGSFLGLSVEGNPLHTFDFGNGLVPVGDASIIVQRPEALAAVSNDTANTGFEVLAFSLRTTVPVDLGIGNGIHYITLSNVAVPEVIGANEGSYDIFFNDPTEPAIAGTVDASMGFSYDIRLGSPTGPIAESGFINMSASGDLTEVSAQWSHLPNDGGGSGPANITIPGVNTFLAGAMDQSEDFFVTATPLFFTDGGVFPSISAGPAIIGIPEITELSLTPANVVADGDSADFPLLPDSVVGNSFVFTEVEGGRWYDPPAASGFDFTTTDGSKFTAVGLPPLPVVGDGDGFYSIIPDVGAAVTVAAGSFYTFPAAVTSFQIRGIDPTVDGGDPLAFPTFLSFDSLSASFTMTPVPEPTSLVLFGLAIAGVIAYRRRK